MPVPWSKALKQQVKNAFSVGIVCTTAAILHFSIDEGSSWRTSTKQGMLFALISVLVIQQDDIGNAGKWMVARILGTLIGSSVGIAFCFLVDRLEWFNEGGAILSVLVAVIAVVAIRSIGMVKAQVLIGNQAAVPAVLFSWDIYTNQEARFLELAVCRICGVLYGVLLSQFAAMVIFPHAASEDLLEKMPSLFTQVKALTESAWDAIMNKTTQEDYEKTRDKVITDAKAVRDLFPKVKLESSLNICGRRVWMPAAYHCGGISLDTKVAEDYVKAVLQLTRFFTSLVGVLGGRLSTDDFKVLDQHYKDKLALSNLQAETMLAIATCTEAINNTKLVQEGSCNTVASCAQSMLKQSQLEDGKIFLDHGPDAKDLFYRWNAFTLLYAEGMEALEELRKATNSWITTVQQLKIQSRSGVLSEQSKSNV